MPGIIFGQLTDVLGVSRMLFYGWLKDLRGIPGILVDDLWMAHLLWMAHRFFWAIPGLSLDGSQIF